MSGSLIVLEILCKRKTRIAAGVKRFWASTLS